MYIVAALGFIVVVAGLVALMLSTQKPPYVTPEPIDTSGPTSTLTERPRSTPPPPASTTPQVEMVEVTIHAQPPLAKIWIDDDLIGTGPHTARYKKDSRHAVRVAFPGYVTKSESMLFAATSSVAIVLEKEGGASPQMPSGKSPTPGLPTNRQ